MTNINGGGENLSRTFCPFQVGVALGGGRGLRQHSLRADCARSRHRGVAQETPFRSTGHRQRSLPSPVVLLKGIEIGKRLKLLGENCMSASELSANYTELTADIVSAYVANNSVPAGHLPELIATIHKAVSGLSQPPAPVAEPQAPAVNPKRSVHPDYIISLEDGKRFKSLKRHLMTHYGLTPEEYRLKWDLPADYPMVAPNYAATRSELAKKMGLGRKRGTKVKAKAGKRSTR